MTEQSSSNSPQRGPSAVAHLAPLNDPAAHAGFEDHPPRMGFFTDTSVCIGCKACEVACKEWNQVPEDGLNLLGMSYDNTGALGASTWRHVALIAQINSPREEPGPGDGARGGSR